MTEGFILLHRKFLKWGWYQNQNTKDLFLHLLLKANHTDNAWQNIIIKRGQCVTSSEHLAKELGLSRQNIRTALNHLKSTNEITVQPTNKYMLITIVKYDFYQGKNFSANLQINLQANQQLTNNQPTANQQLTTNNNDNNDNNDNNSRSYSCSDTETDEIYKLYEKNIGQLSNKIKKKLRGYTKVLCREAVIYAIKEAVMNNKMFFGYVEAVCNGLLKAGVKTPQDLERYTKR